MQNPNAKESSFATEMSRAAAPTTGSSSANSATRRLSHVDVALLEAPSAEQEALWRRVRQVRQVLPQCDVVRVLRALRRVDGAVERATNLLLNEAESSNRAAHVALAPLDVDETVARALHSALVSYFQRHRAVAARTIRAAFADADERLFLVRKVEKKKKKKKISQKKKKKKDSPLSPSLSLSILSP
jgi:hypothetical protein